MCEVCQKVKLDDERLVFQTEYWRVVLSFDQSYVGRLFIPLRTHKNSLSELTDEEWSDFKTIVRRVEAANIKAFDAGRPFNWLCMMNDAYKQTPADPHVHWHMLPRYDHDVEVGAKQYADPNYGHHYDPKRRHPVSPEEAATILEKIKQTLDV